MRTLKIWIVAGLFTSSALSFGADNVVGFGSATTVPLKKNTSSAGEAAVAAANSGQGITDNAKKTKDSNKAGQALNTAVGIANLAMAANCFGECGGGGGGCCPMAPIFLLMGLQNMAQSKAQGNTAGQAGNTYGLTDTGFGTDYDPNAVLQNDPELKKGMDFVDSVTNVDPKKNGFSYDPKTNSITTATGKVVKGNDVNSAGSMAAAGISQGIIDGVSSMEKKIEAAAKKKIDKLMSVAVNGEEAGGGGGGGASGSSSSSGSAGAYGSGAHGSGLGIDRDPAQVAGMQKNYNGEPIGVAGDSIFKMMNRRYKTKENQNTFLDDSELLRK